jgi:hypothetical protein
MSPGRATRGGLALGLLVCLLVAGGPAVAADRCLSRPRTITAATARIDVARNQFVEASGAVRTLDAAVVRLATCGSAPNRALPWPASRSPRDVDTLQAWVSFQPSWDETLAGIPGFAGDITIGLSSPEGRFVSDADLARATSLAYEYVAAVLTHAPELLQGADFTSQPPASFDHAAVIDVLQTVRARLNVGMAAAGSQLPRLAMAPAGRLRGAQLGEWQPWEDPLFSGWSHICEFPAFGGNALRINLQPYYGGQPVLPGQALADRLERNRLRLGEVIEWSLRHNVHVILAINTFGFWPATGASWPDDGRSLWTDPSAQDELVDAWHHIALTYRGRPGLLFELLNEPHNLAGEDYAVMVAAWNRLYPRLIDAIRRADPERWIIVTPRWSDTSELAGFVPQVADRLIVDIHAYAPHYFTHQGVAGVGPAAGSVAYPAVTRDSEYSPSKLWDKAALAAYLRPAIDFGARHGLRMMCGELGANSGAPDDSRARWVADMLDLCESHGFDISYWAYGAGADFGWGFEQTPFRSTVTDALARNLFTIRGTPGGPLSARSLKVSVRPAQADIGVTHRLFVAALLGPDWFCKSASGWQACLVDHLPAIVSTALPAELTLEVLDGRLDLSGAVGAQVYVGYGIDAAEMLARGRYALVHVVE